MAEKSGNPSVAQTGLAAAFVGEARKVPSLVERLRWAVASKMLRIADVSQRGGDEILMCGGGHSHTASVASEA